MAVDLLMAARARPVDGDLPGAPVVPRAPLILVVEDDAVVRRAVRLACERDGLRVVEAASGTAALERIAADRPDLVLLDLLLPGLGGLDVCRAVRRRDETLPIIVVTAKSEETDKVLGLELGADDYVTKPFGPRELVARIHAVLRRASRSLGPSHGGVDADAAGRPPEAPLRCGERTIWLEAHEVEVQGQAVHLTRTEFELLAALARNVGRVLTRDHLVSLVWGYPGEGPSRLLDSHIKHLRRKLELHPARPRYVQTVRHLGYKLGR
jgi:two-component system alkaline phosphatase synthesis response regulator PhoP